MQRDDRAGVIKADLHGMSALSSVVAVEFALSFAPRALHHKLVVVTGKVAPRGRGGYRVLRSGEYTSRNVLGHHSRDRKAVVKPMIEGFLSEEVREREVGERGEREEGGGEAGGVGRRREGEEEERTENRENREKEEEGGEGGKGRRRARRRRERRERAHHVLCLSLLLLLLPPLSCRI
eukprot:1737306-Rhodomonas_salina.2